MKGRVTSVRENQGISKSRFQIRESQGKSTFLEKIREKSGNFIINQGKNQGISLLYLLVIFMISLKNFARAFGARILTEFLKNVGSRLQRGYLLN